MAIVISVEIVPASEELKSVRKFDIINNKLQLSEMLTYTSRNFHLAYQVAFIEAGNVIEEIINAHKKKIKQAHPDKSGSNELASKINRARDILLEIHK